MNKLANSSLYDAILNKKLDLENINNFNLFHFITEKKGFLFLTLLNLIIQISICYFVMEFFNNTISFYETIGVYILISCITLIMVFIPMYFVFKFILFCIVSGLFGFILISLKQTAQLKIFKLFKRVDAQIINFILLGIGSVYFSLALICLLLFISDFHLSYVFGILLFYLLLFIILGNLSSFVFGNLSKLIKTFICLFIVIFSIYFLYDTNNILHRNYYGDFVTASFDYYCDVATIIFILYLFGLNILNTFIDSQPINE